MHLTSGDGTVATKGKTKKPTARREAADETTSSERLTALVGESDALARIVAKNPSAPDSLLRVLSRSEDEATRKSYARKLVTVISGGVFDLLDPVLERHSFDELGEVA